MLIRQPRNPDMKIKSFSKQRIDRLPGQLIFNNDISASDCALTPITVAASILVSNTAKTNEESKISHFNNLISQA